MAANGESLGEVELWGVAIIDIVAYSELPLTEQVHAISKLNRAVSEVLAQRRVRKTDRILLPTGDGMAICLKGHAEGLLVIAREIHRSYAESRVNLKIGIHAGNAIPLPDINGANNIAGSAINLAARVLSCCSAGHILVAADVASDLVGKDPWGGHLSGPYDFEVKWGRRLRAFNYADTTARIGEATEPTTNRVLELQYMSLAERLSRLGVTAVEPLRDDSVLLERLRHPLVLDGMILRGNFAAFQGVPPDRTRVRPRLEPRPLPPYVFEAKGTIPEPEINRPKVFLRDWTGPVDDQGGFLALDLGITDFWTNRAVDACIDRIHAEIRDGLIDLGRWPGETYCDIAVITGDRKFLLCKRAEHLYHEPLKWSVSLEESIDSRQDLDQDQILSPLVTVRRALQEELGIPPEQASLADVRFVAIATDWRNLAAALVTIVRFRTVKAAEVRDYWRGTRDHELIECEPVDLSLDNGLALLRDGPAALAGSARPGDAFHRTARMRILISLFHEFGYSKVLNALP